MTDKHLTKRGNIITDEIAAEIAREAEAGYDLSKAQPLSKAGRKSLAGGRGESPRVIFRVTPNVHERARRRAEREGKTVSQLAREALERYVK